MNSTSNGVKKKRKRKGIAFKNQTLLFISQLGLDKLRLMRKDEEN